MTVAVLTSTCRYGGVDVAVASLERQHREDLVWIVADELFTQRATLLYERAPCPLRAFDSANLRHDGYPKTLSAANNRGLQIAREIDAEMLVFLNDYVWAPEDGIDRFLRAADERPRSLLTGLASMSDDPEPGKVTNPTGLYTVYAEPYTRKPRVLGWRDCRLDHHSGLEPCSVIEWEANWAAIPRDVLHDERVRFDEAYDAGHGYDNQAYALSALAHGYDIWIDCQNEAIGLPHKAYWPQEQRDLQRINNRALHRGRMVGAGYTQGLPEL